MRIGAHLRLAEGDQALVALPLGRLSTRPSRVSVGCRHLMMEEYSRHDTDLFLMDAIRHWTMVDLGRLLLSHRHPLVLMESLKKKFTEET